MEWKNLAEATMFRTASFLPKERVATARFFGVGIAADRVRFPGKPAGGAIRARRPESSVVGGGHSPVTFIHGSTEKGVADIAKNGLDASKAAAASMGHREPVGGFFTHRLGGVDNEAARFAAAAWAATRSGAPGESPGVLTLTISRKLFDKLVKEGKLFSREVSSLGNHPKEWVFTPEAYGAVNAAVKQGTASFNILNVIRR
jgi:hypothetical protein